MSKEKQIEEMACKNCLHHFACLVNSEYVPTPCRAYEDKAAYRKQSENTIELPCNVGDWLWYVYRNEINKAKVEEIRYDASKHGYYSYSFTAYAYDFKNKRQVSYYPPNETTKNDANINEVEGMGYDEEVYVFLSKNEAKAKMKGGAEYA